MGRFLTPDPYMASADGANAPTDPQSWNRYAYVENDPVNDNDPEGLFKHRKGHGHKTVFTPPPLPPQPPDLDPIPPPGSPPGTPGPTPCDFNPQSLLAYMTTAKAVLADGKTVVTGQEPMLNIKYTTEIMNDAIAYNVDPRLLVAISFVEGKWGAEPAAQRHNNSFGTMSNGQIISFSSIDASISYAAYTLHNLMGAPKYLDTVADLYSGNQGAYCVGSNCTSKGRLGTVESQLQAMGGDPNQILSPCWKGSDGNYYKK